MARVSEKSQATLRMNPRAERFTVHQAPLQRGLDKRQQLLNATIVVPLNTASINRIVTHVRWLKVRKIGTHLVPAAFLCPRFDGSVVGVEQYQVELFLRTLHSIRSMLSDLSHREAPKYLLDFREKEMALTIL
jgi:hypothetical protein